MDGFAVIPQAFSATEIDILRNTLSSYFSNGDFLYMHGGKARPDFLNCDELSSLSWILSNEKTVSVLKQLVGHDLMFCHHSDAQMNVTNSWHKDHCSPNPFAPWEPSNDEEGYNVYKIALYLQDYSDGEDYALRVRKGSHMSNSLTQGDIEEINTSAGDAIIFDCRLTHMGYPNAITANRLGTKLISYFRNKDSNGELIENYRHLGGWRSAHKFVNWLEYLALSILDRKRRNPNRLTMLYAFGKPNSFTNQHIQASVKRQNIHNGLDSKNDQSYEVVENLKKAGIKY